MGGGVGRTGSSGESVEAGASFRWSAGVPGGDMLSKREWEQIKSAIQKMHSPGLDLDTVYREDVLNFLVHWVEEEDK